MLRRGVVCGGCNNYFASKVEKPFLESAPIAALRFHQAIPSKRGRIPELKGILQPGNMVVDLSRDSKNGQMTISVPEEGLHTFKTNEKGRLIMLAPNLPKAGSKVSRFVAKVALEALAYKFQEKDEWLEDLVDKRELDHVRDHARRGHPSEWPVSIRKIYDPSDRWHDGENGEYQLINEFDFLYTEKCELFFVLALFGQEYTINMGGPELDGWEDWLAQHDSASPLHSGKNARINNRVD